MDYLEKVRNKRLSIVEMKKLSEKGFSFFDFNKIVEEKRELDFFIEILLLRCPEANLDEVDGEELIRECMKLLSEKGKNSESIKN